MAEQYFAVLAELCGNTHIFVDLTSLNNLKCYSAKLDEYDRDYKA